jgi:group I intron endonuclease
MIGIYLIINCINGKIYVGSSSNISNRFFVHRWELENNKHHNQHLQNAWNKYGEDAFQFCTVEECELSQLIEIEQKWINSNTLGYNVRRIADSNIGIKHPNRTKFSIPPNWMGKKHSEETKRKIGQARKGKRHTEQDRKNIALGLKRRKERLDGFKNSNTLSP